MGRLCHTRPDAPRAGSLTVRVVLCVWRGGPAVPRSVRVGGQLVLGYIAVSPRRALEPGRPVVPRLIERLPGGSGRRRARLVRGHVGTSPQPARAMVTVRWRAQRQETEVAVVVRGRPGV